MIRNFNLKHKGLEDSYQWQLKVLMQKASFFRNWHSYRERIKNRKYNEYYEEADELCGKIIVAHNLV